ncbi:TPA: DUF3150 domain-containing protein [Aeromonas veronii]|nr:MULTISPECIES: DUF3150 domain-containing protein [unclassified Aeromonas]
MTTATNVLAQGFALVQSPVKKGCDGKVALKGSQSILNGQTLTGAAIKEGRVEWFPGDKLRFKGACYKAMDRLIQSYGIAWGAGTLVPLYKLQNLMDEFELLQHKFMQEVDFLQGNYDLYIEAHKVNQPAAVQTVIDAVRLPWAEFRGSFKVVLPVPSVFQPLTDNLQGCATDIVDQAMQEISDQAEEIYDKMLGKKVIDPKSLPPLKRLVEKCRDFAILHPAFTSFVDMFDTLEKTLVPPIAGDVQAQLLGYLGVLSDPNAISTWMSNNQADTDIEDDLLQSIFGMGAANQSSVQPVPVFTPGPSTTAATPAAGNKITMKNPQAAPVAVTPNYDWETFGV